MGVVVSGLDLICGMIEAYRQDCLPLIISIDLIANLPPYLQIMEADVMATAWAIAGESGKSCPASIEASQVQTLVQLGLHALAQRDIKIINNVSWALGHIARAVGPEVFRPYFSSCIDTFSILLTGTFQSLDGAIILPPTVCGNIAITIFLFSEMAPDTVIGHMNKEILPIWLHGLKSIDFEKKSDNDDDEMKESELVVDRVGILMKSQSNFYFIYIYLFLFIDRLSLFSIQFSKLERSEFSFNQNGPNYLITGDPSPEFLSVIIKSLIIGKRHTVVSK